jgi:hypothetical protein
MNIKIQLSSVSIINVNFVTLLIINKLFEYLTNLLRMKSGNSSRHIKFDENYNQKNYNKKAVSHYSTAVINRI